MKSRTPHLESGVFGGVRQRIPPFIFRLFFQISIIRASVTASPVAGIAGNRLSARSLSV